MASETKVTASRIFSPDDPQLHLDEFVKRKKGLPKKKITFTFARSDFWVFVRNVSLSTFKVIWEGGGWKCAEGGDTTVAQSQGRLVMEVSSKGVSCNLS